jgi:hypothetical protein
VIGRFLILKEKNQKGLKKWRINKFLSARTHFIDQIQVKSDTSLSDKPITTTEVPLVVRLNQTHMIYYI